MAMATNSSSTDASLLLGETVSSWFKFFGICLTLLNSALTLLGNALIFIVFFKNISLRKQSNVFFMSLCFADTLFAVLVFPLEVVFLLQHPFWHLGEVVCKVWQSLYVWFGTVSIFNLSAMSVERYFSIKQPLHQEIHFTMRFACCCATGLWIISLASTVLFYSINFQPFPNKCIQFNVSSIEFSVLILFINILLPFLICCVSYIRILRIAKIQSRRVHQQERPYNTASNALRNWREKRNSKAKRTITLLVGAFAFFCLPFSASHIIDAIISRRYPYQQYLEMFVKWLSYYNSAFNWALYAFSNREFKFPIFDLIPVRLRRLEDRNHGNAVHVLSVSVN